jgi:hypothetical protein
VNALTYGTLVLRPDGQVDVTAGYTPRGDQRIFQMAIDRNQRIPEADLIPAIVADLLPTVGCADGDTIAMSRRGAIVSCGCTKQQRGRWHVSTPCCARGRYATEPQQSVECPGCGWLWHVALNGGVTRWLSYGYGKTKRTRRTAAAPPKTATTPAIAITRALKTLGLTNTGGVGHRDFGIAANYRRTPYGKERLATYVVSYSRKTEETIAAHADDIEQAVAADGGWSVTVSVHYTASGRPITHITTGLAERVREQPPTTTPAPADSAPTDTDQDEQPTENTPYCTGANCADCTPDPENQCCEATCGCCPAVNAQDWCWITRDPDDDTPRCSQHG